MPDKREIRINVEVCGQTYGAVIRRVPETNEITMISNDRGAFPMGNVFEHLRNNAETILPKY